MNHTMVLLNSNSGTTLSLYIQFLFCYKQKTFYKFCSEISQYKLE